MMKQFNFPTYEKWLNMKKEYISRVGDYNCKIAAVGWTCNHEDNIYQTTYQCAISIYNNPTNIYTPKTFSDSITLNNDEESSLKWWYNNITDKANIEFAKYIQENYLEESDRDYMESQIEPEE